MSLRLRTAVLTFASIGPGSAIFHIFIEAAYGTLPAQYLYL